MRGLTDRQLDAIEHGDGPCRVLAGPGTGKTTVISHRYAHLVRNMGYPSHQILTITFTAKAGREMRRRCEEVSELRLKSNEVWIGTMHSAYRRILEEEYGPQTILREEDREEILLRLQRRKYRYLSEIRLGDILRRIDQWRLAMVSPEEAMLWTTSLLLEEGHEEVCGLDLEPAGEILTDDQAFAMGFRQLAAAYRDFQREKQDAGAIDFTDMVYETWRLLRGAGDRTVRKWQTTWSYIQVDEFQDIDPCQLEIVKILAGSHRNLFVVGDDDQAIYGFRGASPEAFVNLETEYEDLRTIVLDENFRSPDELVQRASAMIAHNEKRVPKEVRGAQEEAQISYAHHESIEDEADDIVGRIEELVHQGIEPADIAVIYRTNDRSLPFEMALDKLRLPYSVRGTGTFFDLKEIDPLIRYIAIASKQATPASLQVIANIPNRHISRDVIQSWRGATGPILDVLKPEGHRGVEHLHTDLKWLQVMSGGANTWELLDLILNHFNYVTVVSRIYNFSGPDDPDLQNMIEELRAVCWDNPDPRAFLERVKRSREFARRRRTREDAVQLLTFHSAKGLEFEAVFLTGLMEGVMPHKKALESGDVEEERRLAYVGWTRSRRIIHVTSSGPTPSVSRFVAEWGLDQESRSSERAPL